MTIGIGDCVVTNPDGGLTQYTYDGSSWNNGNPVGVALTNAESGSICQFQMYPIYSEPPKSKFNFRSKEAGYFDDKFRKMMDWE